MAEFFVEIIVTLFLEFIFIYISELFLENIIRKITRKQIVNFMGRYRGYYLMDLMALIATIYFITAGNIANIIVSVILTIVFFIVRFTAWEKANSKSDYQKRYDEWFHGH